MRRISLSEDGHELLQPSTICINKQFHLNPGCVSFHVAFLTCEAASLLNNFEKEPAQMKINVTFGHQKQRTPLPRCTLREVETIWLVTTEPKSHYTFDDRLQQKLISECQRGDRHGGGFEKKKKKRNKIKQSCFCCETPYIYRLGASLEGDRHLQRQRPLF